MRSVSKILLILIKLNRVVLGNIMRTVKFIIMSYVYT